MKIKEVSEKTNLTERAIRLYIENGMIAPSVNESYSGRRNIDFSAEDVESLKSISVLRKAEFSISEIKLLQSQPEKSKEVLRDFIDRTNKRIQADTETVTCLMPLLSEEELSLEQIIDCLDSPVMTEKALPSEDSEFSPLQKFIRKLFLSVGIVGLLFNLACCVPIFWVEIRDIRDYLFPQYDLTGIFYLGIVLSAVFLSTLIIFLNRKNIVTSKKRQRIRGAFSVLMICVCVWCSFMSYALAFLAGTSFAESFVISQTTDTENYLSFDDRGARETLPEFLPEKLPDVKGIKYEYFYKQYGENPEPPRTEVFLELPLDEEAFSEAVEKYRAFRPSDSAGEPQEEKKDEWTVVYYRQEDEKAPTCYTPVFAFNEKENRVRFICEYNAGISFRGSAGREAMTRDYKW